MSGVVIEVWRGWGDDAWEGILVILQDSDHQVVNQELSLGCFVIAGLSGRSSVSASFFYSSLPLSSLALSDSKVYEP